MNEYYNSQVAIACTQKLGVLNRQTKENELFWELSLSLGLGMEEMRNILSLLILDEAKSKPQSEFKTAFQFSMFRFGCFRSACNIKAFPSVYTISQECIQNAENLHERFGFCYCCCGFLPCKHVFKWVLLRNWKQVSRYAMPCDAIHVL